MSKKKKRLLHKTGRRYDERLSSKSNQLSQLEQRNKELEELYRKSQEALSEALGGEAIEQLLKNEAYAFILSKGLTKKFLNFRIMGSRSKHFLYSKSLSINTSLAAITAFIAFGNPQ